MSSRTPTSRTCSSCLSHKTPFGYHHVHKVASLPRARAADEGWVAHGYIAQLGGGNAPSELVVFFHDLEPAFVFGRSGRQSPSFGSWSVHAAAEEIRFDYQLDRDVRTLYVDYSINYRSHDDEAQTFERWVAGTTPASSSYLPGARRRGAPTH